MQHSTSNTPATLFPQQPITPEKLKSRIMLLQQWGLLFTNPPCNGNIHPPVPPGGRPVVMRLRKRNTCADGYRFECSARDCRKTQGLRIGTIFEDFRLDLGKMTYAIYLWTLRLIGKEISVITGIAQNYITLIRQKIRRSCWSDLMRPPGITINGNGWTVQMDESLFNHKPKRVGNRPRGRRARQQIWVFGMIETRPPAPGRGVYVVVPNRRRRTLVAIINHYLRGNNVTIHTDCWRGYLNLTNFVPRCTLHETVNHSRHFVDPITGAHIQGIESAWNRIKTQIKKSKGCRRAHLQSYLNEHMWFEWKAGNDAFVSICGQISRDYPVV